LSKEKVEIKGADMLDDITLLRVVPGDFLPPFEEIAAQLTGSEWLQNLPGTGEDKKTLTVYCNFCHEYQQIFRNHYDENGWARIVVRMTHGAGSTRINIRNPGRLPPADGDALQLLGQLPEAAQVAPLQRIQHQDQGGNERE
jgi:hypothetical protein